MELLGRRSKNVEEVAVGLAWWPNMSPPAGKINRPKTVRTRVDRKRNELVCENQISAAGVGGL